MVVAVPNARREKNGPPLQTKAGHIGVISTQQKCVWSELKREFWITLYEAVFQLKRVSTQYLRALLSIFHSQCLCWLYSMLIDWIAGGCPWRLPCCSASQGRTDKTAVMTSWGRKQLVAEQVIGHLVFACHLDISSPHRISQQVSRSLKVLQQHCLV